MIMTTAWIMAVVSGAATAAVGLAGKGAEHGRCRPTPYCLIVFAIAGGTAFLATLGREAGWGDGRLWLLGGTMGALYWGCLAAMLRANRCWPPSIVWAAANMAFVLPLLLSALFLGEPLRPVDIAIVTGAALMLAGLAEKPGPGGQATAAGPQETSNRTRWTLLGIVFALNGLLMFGYKLFGTAVPGRHPACLVAVIYGCGAVLAGMTMVGRGAVQVNRAELSWGLAAGVASGLSALALLSAMRLPAAAAFPVIQGTSLVGGVLLCALFFRERLTRRKLISLGVGLGTMALTLVR